MNTYCIFIYVQIILLRKNLFYGKSYIFSNLYDVRLYDVKIPFNNFAEIRLPDLHFSRSLILSCGQRINARSQLEEETVDQWRKTKIL